MIKMVKVKRLSYEIGGIEYLADPTHANTSLQPYKALHLVFELTRLLTGLNLMYF